MAATGGTGRPRRGRDVYPLRILATGLGFILVMVVALIWALLSGDDSVHVTERADIEDAQETAATPGRHAEPAARPAETDVPAPELDPGADPDTARTLTQPLPSRQAAAAPSPAAGSVPVDDVDIIPDTPRAPAASRDSAIAPRSNPPALGTTADPVDAALLADAFHTEGVYRLEHGDFDIAVQRFARAVEASPRNPVYRGNYGWALFKAGDATGAAAEIEESIRLGGDRPIPYANLAEVRLVQGDTAAALAAYSRFIQLNDDAALDADAERRIREIRRR